MSVGAGPHYIDDTLTFTVNTHRVDTGAATDADSVPTYRIYEDETGTAILNGNTAKLDDANTTGFYSEQITLSAANGFEVGKSYSIYVAATVNSVAGTQSFNFKVVATLATASALDTVDNFLDSEIATIVTAVGAIETDTQDIQARLPAALVSGRIDASVGAMAANVMTAAAAAADLTTELQNGLATAAALDAVDNFVDTEIGAIKTVVDAIQAKTDNLPSDPADASVIAGRFDTLDTSVADLPTNAELATALGTADDAVLAQVALVKAKTDNLPSDPADQSLIIAATDAIVTAIGDLPTNAELATALGSADDAVLAILGTPAGASIADDIANISAGSGLDAQGVRDAIGLASANLDTQLGDLPTNAELATALGTADDAVKTVVDAIKVQTDKLTFTVANQIDANVQFVNDVQVNGVGTAGNPWGP